MLTIKFKLDKDILARTIIAKSCMPTKYANSLWDKYRGSYISIQRKFNTTKINNDIIKEVQAQDFFADLYEKSESNLKRIRTNFNRRKTFINHFLKNILRCEFDLDTTAYIVAPEINFGSNIVFANSRKGNNEFVYGHTDGLINKNYDLVYLVHEALHSYFKLDEICHTVIENITDIELQRTLNHDKNKVYDCHEFLRNIHVKVFPFWNLYLNRTKEEILKEQENFNIFYDINKFEKYRNRLSKMNINQFVKFLKNQVDKISFKMHYEII